MKFIIEQTFCELKIKDENKEKFKVYFLSNNDNIPNFDFLKNQSIIYDYSNFKIDITKIDKEKKHLLLNRSFDVFILQRKHNFYQTTKIETKIEGKSQSIKWLYNCNFLLNSDELILQFESTFVLSNIKNVLFKKELPNNWNKSIIVDI